MHNPPFLAWFVHPSAEAGYGHGLYVYDSLICTSSWPLSIGLVFLQRSLSFSFMLPLLCWLVMIIRHGCHQASSSELKFLVRVWSVEVAWQSIENIYIYSYAATAAAASSPSPAELTLSSSPPLSFGASLIFFLTCLLCFEVHGHEEDGSLCSFPLSSRFQILIFLSRWCAASRNLPTLPATLPSYCTTR